MASPIKPTEDSSPAAAKKKTYGRRSSAATTATTASPASPADVSVTVPRRVAAQRGKKAKISQILEQRLQQDRAFLSMIDDEEL